MTTNELKDILAAKLKDEGTYFKKSDIKMQKLTKGYKVTIRDYEHIPFIITLSQDEDFGYVVMVKEMWGNPTIIFKDSSKDYPMYETMLSLGYYIGTRF